MTGPTCTFVSYETEAEWLEARRKCVTASDVPILLGMLPMKSPWDVWMEKVEGIVREGDKYLMRRGHALEDFIADEYSRETGRGVHDPGDFTIAYHSTIPWAAATIDRLTWDPGEDLDDEFEPVHTGVLELKAPTPYGFHKYGESADPYAIAQVQWQQFVTGLAIGQVAVEFGTRTEVYEHNAHPKLQARLFAHARKFHESVESGEPLPPDAHQETAKAMARYFPATPDLVIQLNGESAERWELRERSIDLNKASKDERTGHENWFRLALGEATVGVLPDGREVTWHPDKNGVRRLNFKEVSQ